MFYQKIPKTRIDLYVFEIERSTHSLQPGNISILCLTWPDTRKKNLLIQPVQRVIRLLVGKGADQGPQPLLR